MRGGSLESCPRPSDRGPRRGSNMEPNSRLMERFHVVWPGAPKDITGAGLDGAWVSLKYYRRLLVLFTSGAWAAGNSAVTLEQATTAAGAGAKSLAFSWMWVGTNTNDVPVKTAVVSSTFN